MEEEVKNTNNTEQLILKCAEEVFIERGFAGAKTTEIARRAGVNHAMLHYYFRTKQNLFNVVFEDKIALLATSFADAFTSNVSFFEKVKGATEAHFDFISKNPRLLFFLYSEVINDDDRKKLIVKNILPKAETILVELDKSIELELQKGTIRPIKAFDIILNIVSLNITTFFGMPLIETIYNNPKEVRKFLQDRKRSNVDFIIHSLQPSNNKKEYVQATLDFGF